MRLSFSTLGCPNYSLSQAIDAALEHGYQGIGIRTISGATDLPSLPEFRPEKIKETNRQLAAAGIEVVCVSSSVRFSAPERAQRHSQLATAVKYVDIAASLSAPFVRLFGGPVNQDTDLARAKESIVAGYRATAAYAATKGVSVLLENHDTFSTGLQCKHILDGVGRSNVGLVWDVFHSFRNGESIEETWKHVGEYVKHVHLKDARIYTADSYELTLCGCGDVPLQNVVKLLRDEGYSRYLSFEWEKAWHPEIEEATVALPHYVEFMVGLFEELNIPTFHRRKDK